MQCRAYLTAKLFFAACMQCTYSQYPHGLEKYHQAFAGYLMTDKHTEPIDLHRCNMLYTVP